MAVRQPERKRPVNPVLDASGNLEVILIIALRETRHGYANESARRGEGAFSATGRAEAGEERTIGSSVLPRRELERIGLLLLASGTSAASAREAAETAMRAEPVLPLGKERKVVAK